MTDEEVEDLEDHDSPTERKEIKMQAKTMFDFKKKLKFEEPERDIEQYPDDLLDQMNERVEHYDHTSAVDSDEYEREFDQIMNYHTTDNNFHKKSVLKSSRKHKKGAKMAKT